MEGGVKSHLLHTPDSFFAYLELHGWKKEKSLEKNLYSEGASNCLFCSWNESYTMNYQIGCSVACIHGSLISRVTFFKSGFSFL